MVFPFFVIKKEYSEFEHIMLEVESNVRLTVAPVSQTPEIVMSVSPLENGLVPGVAIVGAKGAEISRTQLTLASAESMSEREVCLIPK